MTLLATSNASDGEAYTLDALVSLLSALSTPERCPEHPEERREGCAYCYADDIGRSFDCLRILTPWSFAEQCAWNEREFRGLR